MVGRKKGGCNGQINSQCQGRDLGEGGVWKEAKNVHTSTGKKLRERNCSEKRKK